MKKFSLFALLVMGLFISGCNPPKPAAPKTDAPPADMPAEKSDATPEKPADAPATPEKPAEPETK